MPTTLNEAIGLQVRRLRNARGWTQDRLAARLRDAGFTGWTRSMVAALETRRRQVPAGDLIVLSVALGVTPAELLPRGRRWVTLDDGSSIRLERAALILEGLPPGQGASAHGTRPPASRRMRGAPSSEAVSRAAKGELERRLARVLGVPPKDVAVAALGLWGRSATEERDRRAPDPRQLGVRRNTSRGVREELAAAIRERG